MQQSGLAYSCLGCLGLSLCSVLSRFAELSWDTSVGSFCFVLLFCFPMSLGSNLWELLVALSVLIQPCEDQDPVPTSRGSCSCFALRDTIGLIWQGASCLRSCPTSKVMCMKELASYRHDWSFSHQPEANFTEFSERARPTARSFEKKSHQKLYLCCRIKGRAVKTWSIVS